VLVYNGNVEPDTELPILVQLEFLNMPKNNAPAGEMRLYAQGGKRLYVNESERARFIAVAKNAPAMTRIFCLTLAFTGCRISEALFLRRGDLQYAERRLAIKPLKRRKTEHIREIPIPEELAEEFIRVHFKDIEKRNAWMFCDDEKPPSRSDCYRRVKSVMKQADICGLQACPKGLRHGYGIHAIKSGVQLHMLQKWMGHADMSTTAIYATALGPDEQEIAARMW